MTGKQNAAELLAQLKDAHPQTRWLILDRVARDYGDGFAAVLKKQVERDDEKRRSTRRG